MLPVLSDPHRRHLALTIAVAAGLAAYLLGSVEGVLGFDLARGRGDDGQAPHGRQAEPLRAQAPSEVSTGRPASTQARVPPVTLDRSMKPLRSSRLAAALER